MAQKKTDKSSNNKLEIKYKSKGTIRRTTVDSDGRIVVHLSENECEHTQAGELPINFSADKDYSTNYLQDTYEPEQSRVLQSLSRSIIGGFDNFLKVHEHYSYLRSADLAHIRIGDKAQTIVPMDDKVTQKRNGSGTIVRIEQAGYYVVQGKEGKIRMTLPTSAKIGQSINLGSKFGQKVKVLEVEEDNYFHVCYPDETIRIPASRLKPVDDFINKLKPSDISLLYTWIRSTIITSVSGAHNNLFGEVEYFYVFSEHFRINERVLLQSLPVKIKNLLFKCINTTTGVMSKTGRTGF